MIEKYNKTVTVTESRTVRELHKCDVCGYRIYGINHERQPTADWKYADVYHVEVFGENHSRNRYEVCSPECAETMMRTSGWDRRCDIHFEVWATQELDHKEVTRQSIMEDLAGEESNV